MSSYKSPKIFNLNLDNGFGAMMRQRPGIKKLPIIFAMLLIMGAFVVVAPNIVNAAQEGDYTYTVANGNATVTGYTGSGGDITIPSSLGGNPTRTIGASAFYGDFNVTSITIPSSVTGIGNYAFQNCTNLTSITIPNGVTSIGASAFANCISLISVILPDNLTMIDFSLFSHCASLISIVIPNSVTTIRDDAFRECSSLASITLPNNLVFVGDAPFDYCSALTSIIIPSTVTKIRVEVFAYCSSLTSVFFLGNIQSIGARSFLNCRSLVSISFYGLNAPAITDSDWINGTPSGLLGHAYVYSNFPLPGGDFHGLTMGAFIPLVPGAPTNFVATPGNTQVDLTWSLPVGSSSISIIKNYNVYRAASGNGTFSLIGTSKFLNYTDNALNNGQIYWYEVSAVNSKGEGAMTAPLSATPYTVPNAQTGLMAVAGNSNVTLNWTAPAFEGGRAIDYYVVYQEGVALPDNVTGLTTVITGLTNGVTYNFTVAAHNLAGLGAQSDTVASIPYTVPNPPIDLTAISGSDKVTLNWTAPAFDGGRAIDYYIVYQDGVALVTNVTGLNTTIVGLTNGHNYSFAVAAHNLAGVGDQSNNVSATPSTSPDAPTGLMAVAGNGQAILNWTAPAFDGGRAIDYYVVYQDGVALADNLTDLNATITGLTNGQQYSFSVAAHNVVGLSVQSNVANVTPNSVADAPTGLMAVAGNSNVTLNWTAPIYVGPGTITYHVFRDGRLVWSGTSTIYLDMPLMKNISYSYSVAAQNSIGWGPNCSEVQATPFGVPDAPIGLTAIAGNENVSLNWTAPNYLGPGLIKYHLFRESVLIWNGTGLGYIDIAVVNGFTYTYEVSANNSIGWGPNSTTVQAMPMSAEQTPTAPRNLMGTAGFENVTLTWDAPAYSNASAVSGYIISFGISPDSLINQITWDQLVYILDGLTKGQVYYFSIAAQNDAGWGPNSTIISATPVGVPSVPLGFEAIAGNSNITLNWTAPSYLGPGMITYHLFRDGVEVWSGAAINNSDSGLINGQIYEYNVAASNSVGWGANSSVVSSAPQGRPTAPTGLQADAESNFVQLNWSAPTYAGPGTLTYHLFRNGTLVFSGSDVEFNDTGVVNFVHYSYQVAAENLIGWGPNSTAIDARPMSSGIKPTAPRDLVVVPGNRNVTLTWGVPLYSNASFVSLYMISYGTIPGSMTNITLNHQMYVLSGLTKGVTYYFSVKAQNSAGWGDSSSIESTTPFGVPNAPTNLTATVGDSRVSLSWSTPTYSGPGSLAYHLFRDDVLLWSGDTLTYNDTNVTNGQEYTYKVMISNGVGWGENSTEIQATPQANSSLSFDTLLYVGIGAIAIIVLVGVAFVVLRKRK